GGAAAELRRGRGRLTGRPAAFEGRRAASAGRPAPSAGGGGSGGSGGNGRRADAIPRAGRGREAVLGPSQLNFLQRLAGPRHVLVAVDPKAVRVPAGFAGVFDADAVAYGHRFYGYAFRNAQRRIQKVPAVVLPGNAQGLAQLARAVGEIVVAAAALDHLVHAPGGLQRPDEDGVGDAFRAADHVEAVVAVDGVDVRFPRRPEHHLGAGSA